MNIDMIWLLICAALVFFMQAGFKCFEAGLVREQHRTGVAMKNLIDWLVVSLFFFVSGFGLMFGKSSYGAFGTNIFFLKEINSPEASPLGWSFYLFQLAFAGTAVTIVSGAMAERTGFVAYLSGSVFMVLVIYPVFGHWVWGDSFFGNNRPWLAALGFMDFAGSSVVHSVGAWVALVGVWITGPRLGRYNEKGEIRSFRSKNYALSVLGVIILWIGWWGFNGGSSLQFDKSIGRFLVNTNISGASAGFAAFFHCYFLQNRQNINEKLLGGILGGLVACTASCNIITPEKAYVIGTLAGIIHNYGFDFVTKRLRLDDVVGAIPVHGICGAFGTLCVALFGHSEALAHPRLTQLGVQLLGIVVCFVWATSTAFLMYNTLKVTVGLRVSPLEEIDGIHIGGIVEDTTLSDTDLDEAALTELMS